MAKNNQRYLFLTFFYLALTFGFLFLIYKFGIKTAVQISSFLQSRNSQNQSVVSTDLAENILPEPQLLPLPEATNSSTLTISGYSLPNQKVNLYLNDLPIKVLDVNSEGKFTGEISLALGLSKIYAVTINSDNIQGPPSKVWTVFYSNSPPYLEITEPANNSTITGKNDFLLIKGKTNQTSKVFVNSQRVVIENDGSFSYPVNLQKGENKFTIECFDPASNKTQVDWVINYQP